MLLNIPSQHVVGCRESKLVLVIVVDSFNVLIVAHHSSQHVGYIVRCHGHLVAYYETTHC